MHEDNPPVTSVCFAPNGRYVLAHSIDSCIRLWDYVSGTVKKTYQGHVNKGFSIGGCFGAIDGEAFVASASEDGGVVLWDVKSKQVVQRIDRGHDGVCFWVDVNGDTLVSAGQDCKIRVYRHHRPGALEHGVGGVGINGLQGAETAVSTRHGINGVTPNGHGDFVAEQHEEQGEVTLEGFEKRIGGDDSTSLTPTDNEDADMQEALLEEADVKTEQP